MSDYATWEIIINSKEKQLGSNHFINLKILNNEAGSASKNTELVKRKKSWKDYDIKYYYCIIINNQILGFFFLDSVRFYLDSVPILYLHNLKL